MSDSALEASITINDAVNSKGRTFAATDDARTGETELRSVVSAGDGPNLSRGARSASSAEPTSPRLTTWLAVT